MSPHGIYSTAWRERNRCRDYGRPRRVPSHVWQICRRNSSNSIAVTLDRCLVPAEGHLHLSDATFYPFWLSGSRSATLASGDFTVVCPLACGSAPLLSFLGAIFLPREHSSSVAVFGAVLISLGILFSFGVASVFRNRVAIRRALGSCHRRHHRRLHDR